MWFFVLMYETIRDFWYVRYMAAIFAGMCFLRACDSYAAWTPLIQSTDFTGILTDLGTTVVGIVSMLLIVAGIGFIVRALTH